MPCVHAIGSSRRWWLRSQLGTTSDGREGFQTIFLRRGFPVYLVDQPRRGRAGNSTVAATIEPTPFDQLFFDQFRIGKWPDYFENVQFDRSSETLDQFLRSVTPNTGPYDAGVISDAMAALFEKTGPAVLFNHSQAGGPGWLTAIKSENVKGIVALEPGSGFIFPEGELPEAMPSAAGTLTPEAVPLADFEKLTRVPIIIYYGDNFPIEPMTERGQDNWRVRLAMAKLWVEGEHHADITIAAADFRLAPPHGLGEDGGASVRPKVRLERRMRSSRRGTTKDAGPGMAWSRRLPQALNLRQRARSCSVRFPTPPGECPDQYRVDIVARRRNEAACSPPPLRFPAAAAPSPTPVAERNPHSIKMWPAGSCMRGFRTPAGTRNPSPKQTSPTKVQRRACAPSW